MYNYAALALNVFGGFVFYVSGVACLIVSFFSFLFFFECFLLREGGQGGAVANCKPQHEMAGKSLEPGRIDGRRTGGKEVKGEAGERSICVRYFFQRKMNEMCVVLRARREETTLNRETALVALCRARSCKGSPAKQQHYSRATIGAAHLRRSRRVKKLTAAKTVRSTHTKNRKTLHLPFSSTKKNGGGGEIVRHATRAT